MRRISKQYHYYMLRLLSSIHTFLSHRVSEFLKKKFNKHYDKYMEIIEAEKREAGVV